MKRQNPKTARIFTLITIPLTLSLIGLLFVFEASAVRSFNEVGNSFYYVKYQTIWICLGLIVLAAFSLFDYHNLYYFSFLLMSTSIALLLLVLIPGIGQKIGGARRWIDLGFMSLQPTEFAKFASIIYLSSWFIHKERKRFFSFLILLGILMFLIFLQPDMGTAAIIFFLAVSLYFLAGIDLHYLLGLLPASVVGFLFLIKISPYRFGRLLAYFNPKLDPLGITYHINQILISLSNGGWFGQGYGASRQKFLFLPEAHTDSIFAIISEEIGFIGSVFLIGLYLVFSYRMFKAVTHSSDRFGKLLAGGVFAFFNFQILINLGGMVNLLPLTGVPLPFISYGGSNMLVSFALLGILVNIVRQSKVT